MKRSASLAAVLAATAAIAGIASAKAPAKHHSHRKPIGAYTTKGAWSFVSAPRLHPPKPGSVARVKGKKLAPGDFLLANFPNTVATEVQGKSLVGQSGPLILDNRLQPVWFDPVPTNVVAGNLQQETYLGQPVLVWWQGVTTKTGDTASGEVVVADQHYRTVATLKARAPWVISLHDAVISGTSIWVTAYRLVPHQNLTRYHGSKNATLYDAAVQEYDLKTGVLLYTWDALDHVPLSASEQPPLNAATPWDAYHLNSIQVLSPDQILISMRNTWAVYLVNVPTGNTVWTLGGKHSTFRGPAKAHFAWQHDARLLANGDLTVFNDDCCKQLPTGSYAAPNGPSTGMVLKLDQTKHTASSVAAYGHKPTIKSYYLGSMQLLPGSRALVGWGNPSSYFTEYDRSGRQLLDVYWPIPDLTYRALYTGSWVGTPYYPPSGAVRGGHGKTTIYASWNGATQVASWEVLAGSSSKALKVVAKRRESGFETAISLKKGARFYEVRALGAKGRTLGTSRAFK